MTGRKVVLFANTDWYLYNFRRSLAQGLREQGYEPILVSPEGPYAQRLIDLGFRWKCLPLDRRSLNPLVETRLILNLVRLLRQERPILIHNFTIKCAVYGSVAARLAAVPARINSLTGLGYVFANGDLRARLLRPLVRSLLRLTLGGSRARLIVQNCDDLELLRRY